MTDRQHFLCGWLSGSFLSGGVGAALNGHPFVSIALWLVAVAALMLARSDWK